MTKNFGQPRIIVLVVVSIIPQNIICRNKYSHIKCNSHEMVTFSRPPPILQKWSSDISPWPPNPVVSNIIYRQNAKFSTMLHQDGLQRTARPSIATKIVSHVVPTSPKPKIPPSSVLSPKIPPGLQRYGNFKSLQKIIFQFPCSRPTATANTRTKTCQAA